MKRKSFLQIGALSPFFALSAFSAKSAIVSGENGIIESEREISVMDEYDVIISGAVPAGVSAAIEAGRNGAKTFLAEVHGCLGGVWTSGLLTWILDQANKSGLMREIEHSLVFRYGVSREIDTGNVLSFDPEIMKLLLEELCLEAGVDILFHTRVVASVKNENR